MKLKLISNIPNLSKVNCPECNFEYHNYQSGGGILRRIYRMFNYNKNYDYVVFNMMQSDVYILSFIKYLLPFWRCRLVVIDLILPIPDSFLSQIMRLVKSILLKKVYLFINYAKDNSGFEKLYYINRSKFRYIPFKVNNYEEIINTTPIEGEYVFVGGQTRRDFKTFLEAVDGLPYPIHIVAPEDSTLAMHGTSLDVRNLPNNIVLVRNATSAIPFIEQIANSKMVVIPVVKRNISPSGIGVYLQCMRLKKCVIISSGPSVDDILVDDQAIVIPPEDPAKLREAIIKAYEDKGFRDRIALSGYQYAVKLGDEMRLNNDLVTLICSEHSNH